MNIPSTRSYRMEKRSARAEETARHILDAAKQGFGHCEYSQVSLAAVARDAGVTEQTVIRRFRSKENLFSSVIEREMARVEEERVPPAGEGCSLDEAIQVLMAHYEKDGRAMLNFLAQENRSQNIRALVESGRTMHENWVSRYCLCVLYARDPIERYRRLAAAIAATDIYTWKLLRLDRGLPMSEVENIVKILLRGLNCSEV